MPQGDGSLVWVHNHEVPPRKRARGSGRTKGIPKGAQSGASTSHEPVARIPRTKINDKPKAGRGAERLATPSAQGVYHQTLPGPSFQRDSVVDAAHGKPAWVEGSDDEEAAHHSDDTQNQKEENTKKLFYIPHRFEPRHMMFLQASESDAARGAVEAIKCRVCLDMEFKDFNRFKRHCDFTEVHPLVIHFCNLCGDFFARSDALVRHGTNRPSECPKVTPNTAVQKHRETVEAHEDFVWGLQHCLNTGQDTRTLKPFNQIIKDKFPGSSKKRTRRRR